MDAENYVMDGMHHGTGSTLRMQPTHTRPHARDGHTLQPGRQSTAHGSPCGQIGRLRRL